MGDIKKLRKKYSKPMHPWNKANIESERIIKREYGLKNKTEIYVVSSFLKKYKDIAKRLIATKTAQAEKEKQHILAKLQQLGLLTAGADLDQILGLELKDVLERRLQSLVFRKELAKSMNQARQFIVHRHIMVGNKEISAPSYLVSLEEESLIAFKPKSSLADVEHPERMIKAKKAKDEGKKLKTEPAKEKNPKTGLAKEKDKTAGKNKKENKLGEVSEKKDKSKEAEEQLKVEEELKE